MNKDKVIKDLKERNDKLKYQYELLEVQKVGLEYRNENLNYLLGYFKTKIDKAVECIENFMAYNEKPCCNFGDLNLLLEILKEDD